MLLLWLVENIKTIQSSSRELVIPAALLTLSWVLYRSGAKRRNPPLPPGPPGLPLIGNLLDARELTSHQWLKFTKWYHQYGMILPLSIPMSLLKSMSSRSYCPVEYGGSEYYHPEYCRSGG